MTDMDTFDDFVFPEPDPQYVDPKLYEFLRSVTVKEPEPDLSDYYIKLNGEDWAE